MKSCANCLLPETHETITFEESACNICTNSKKKKKTVDWKDRKSQLDNIISEYKKQNNSYDCIIPFSGGKDSSWNAYYLKKNYNLKPLLVRFDHGFLRKNLNENVKKLCKKLGLDIVSFKPDWKTTQKLMLKSLIDKGDFCWHCHTGIYTYPIRVALEKKIPLIIWGEGSGEYEDYYHIDDLKSINERYINRVVNLGINAEDMFLRFNGEIKRQDLLPYTYPTKREMKDFEIKSICLGDYIQWDIKKHVEILKKEIGWRGDVVENVPPEYDYEKIECYMQGVRDYIKYIKRGYSRATHLVSLDLRNGRINKEKAKEIIKLYEGKRPATLDIFLDYIGLSEEQFNTVVSSHIVKPNIHNFESKTNSKKNPDHDTYDTSGKMDKKYAQSKFKEWFLE